MTLAMKLIIAADSYKNLISKGWVVSWNEFSRKWELTVEGSYSIPIDHFCYADLGLPYGGPLNG